jgi:hypothetical protein
MLSHTGAESLAPRASDSSAVATGLGYLPLTELILRSRISLEPKKRLAAVQWARALFLWSPVVLETMALLAGKCMTRPFIFKLTFTSSYPPFLYLLFIFCFLFCYLLAYLLFPFIAQFTTSTHSNEDSSQYCNTVFVCYSLI